MTTSKRQNIPKWKHKINKALDAAIWNQRLGSREYTQRRLTFGKYVNWQIKDVPLDYVKWAIENWNGAWAEMMARELQRRDAKFRSASKSNVV